MLTFIVSHELCNTQIHNTPASIQMALVLVPLGDVPMNNNGSDLFSLLDPGYDSLVNDG